MADVQPRSFGDLLRHARLEADLTQEELAERAGLSVRAISDLERGVNRTPQLATLQLLAVALQLSAEEQARFEASAHRRGTPSAPARARGRTTADLTTYRTAAHKGAPPTASDTPTQLSSGLTLVPDPPSPPVTADALAPEVLPAPLKPSVPLRKRLKQPSGLRAALLIGLVVVVSAAGVLGGLSVVRQRGPTAPVPVRGGTWTDELLGDLTSLIPHGDGDAFASNILVDQALYLPLFYIDAQGEVHPGAARELPTLKNGGIKADATIWTFHLRPGLVWSDGMPYDARDVDYTWRLWADPAFRGSFDSRVGYELIRSATVSPDSLSITFALKQPFVPFLSYWLGGEQAPMPAHHFSMLKPGQIFQTPDERNPTVTSGPFMMVESAPADHYTLVRNPRYYLASQGLPYLDRLVFRVGASIDTIFQDFQAGAVDSTQLDRNVDHLQAYQQLSGYTLVRPPTSAAFEALFFNFYNTVLAAHLEVREAMARAIDHQALIQGPLAGFATPLCTVHPSAVRPGYQPGASCPVFGQEAANKLLNDRGWVRGADGVRARDGQRLEFEYATTVGPSNPWRKAVQRLIQQNLLAIGIKLDIQNYPGQPFFNSFLPTGEASPPTGAVAGRFDIAEFGWTYNVYGPDDYLLLMCNQTWSDGLNYGSYCNPALDALYQQELVTLDPGVQQNLFNQMHLIQVTDFPLIVLFSPLTVSVVRNGIHNYAPSPFIGETVNVWEWWCDQSKC
jgi:peptide/nickel transport system substrate-binding protein